jgi:hypothetical protein
VGLLFCDDARNLYRFLALSILERRQAVKGSYSVR